MKVLAKTGKEEIAIVYIGMVREGSFVEFVESLQPPLSRKEKWVLIVSSLLGCPCGCVFCDGGFDYKGKLTKDEIFSQIDFLVEKRFPDRNIEAKKFKVQFARVGEPALNPAVIEVLKELPSRYNAPGLIPCISTIAPSNSGGFFEKLLDLRKSVYRGKDFQLQFSIHTTNKKLRDKLIPFPKWDFEKIAEYGEIFYEEGRRKITLNFALASCASIEPSILLKYFDPRKFLLKITPVNPTYKAVKNKIFSFMDKAKELIHKLQKGGYEVIESIGELEENKIGSNCGQYIQTHLREKEKFQNCYTYLLTPNEVSF
ncbi:MAG: radical SAM protein [candidate division WOR-3 bacterium]